MSTREFFLKQFKAERPKFLSVIRALPTARLDYRPHEKSTAAKDIAWFLVIELRALLDLARTGESRWKQPPAPDSTDTLAAEYDKISGELEQALTSVDDARFEGEATMYVGDRVMMQKPLGDILWNFFFDAIHHRGQLTTYIRPMGGKVPSVYGPSGDSK